MNARNIEEARRRYGRPFVTETRAPRLTAPSTLLRHLNRLSMQANENRGRGHLPVLSARDFAQGVEEAEAVLNTFSVLGIGLRPLTEANAPLSILSRLITDPDADARNRDGNDQQQSQE